MNEEIKKITIIGAGTQGSMLAFRAVAYQNKVQVYDISEEATRSVPAKIEKWLNEWVRQGKIDEEMRRNALENLSTTSNLQEALEDSDLVIENVPEVLLLKQKVWEEVDHYAPEKTLLTTNSSSLKSSDIGKNVSRKSKTFNVNFMTPTEDDLVEVMWNGFTSDETKHLALDYLTGLKHVPIVTNMEIKGFSLNRVWRAIKKECLKLWANGYISPEDFDRAWILEWGTPYGPFALMDKVGLDIVRQIEMTYYDESQDPNDLPPIALDEMIKEGRLGEKTQKGFYNYPNPAYQQEGWLKGENKKE
jgi:3-hydroxybutyryl-CoA dehydrogenase